MDRIMMAGLDEVYVIRTPVRERAPVCPSVQDALEVSLEVQRLDGFRRRITVGELITGPYHLLGGSMFMATGPKGTGVDVFYSEEGYQVNIPREPLSQTVINALQGVREAFFYETEGSGTNEG